MFGLFTTSVLGVHLLATNLASAGPLLGIWLGRYPADKRSLRENLGRTMAWLSLWAMILSMFTGGLLYFAPSPGLGAALARLPSRALWFAGSELAFSLICLLLYALSWRALCAHRWWHAWLAVLSSSNLLYHFPPLMGVLGKLAANPTWASVERLDRRALLPLMMRSEVLALTSHFVLASVTVAAITVLWLLSKTSADCWKETALPLSRRTAWIALFASAMQVPVGVWLLVSLPNSARTALMGNSPIASAAFLGALLLTFLLLQRLLTIAIGSVQRSDLRQVTWLLAILVLLMTAALQSTRSKNVTANRKAVEHSATWLMRSTAAGSVRLAI